MPHSDKRPGSSATTTNVDNGLVLTTHLQRTRDEVEVRIPVRLRDSKNIHDVADDDIDAFKSVISRINTSLKTYEDDITSNNLKKTVADTIDKLNSLEHMIPDRVGDLNESERRDKLQSALLRISKDLGQIPNENQREGIPNSAHDEQMLVGCVEDIRQALRNYQMLDLYQTADGTTLRSAVSPHLVRNAIHGASSEVNPRPGFFAGAKDVDASQGIFNDAGRDIINIGRNVNIRVENQGNDISALNRLRRAKDAGYRSKYHQQCLPGTRRAELERIEKWEVDFADKRVYWLNGLAGTGKSTIAQTFAERSSALGRLGASFFCSRDFSDRRNIHLIFPTIAFGLAHRYPNFRDALMKIMSSSPDAADESLAIQLEDLLVRPLKATNLRTTIVIDALDECEDNEPASAILSLLAQHINTIPSVKFFITGRPEIPIRTGFRLPLLQPHTEVFVLHDVDPSSVNQDIELYVRTCLTEIATERSHFDLTDPWPAEDDIRFLVKRSSGMFIVASIITKLIREDSDPEEQLKIIIMDADSTIHEGRSGVDAMYYYVFLRSLRVVGVNIRDTDVFDLLRLVVGSIVLVFNPLSCADLAKILDIPQERVRSAIRSLHSVLIVPHSNAQLLRICHKSLADFLIDLSRCVAKSR